jgi:Ca-activated chloride channel family protein
MRLLALQSPEALLWTAAVLLGLIVVRWFLRQRDTRRLYFPGARWLAEASGIGRWLPRLGTGLIALSLAILMIALGRPVYQNQRVETATEGVDIVLALDISTSMSAQDFQPGSRLEAARSVLREFIARRPHDRLSLITFAADAYVVCPLTSDHYTLTALLDAVELIPFDADGTAIGMALASAINRLRDSPARSKVVVLLTDGINNKGEISPLQAAEFCRRYGIRVYTVGIGSDEETKVMARAPDGRPVWIQARVESDPRALEEIARTTGGKAYTAADVARLKGIYSEIDSLEKTVLERKTVTYQEDLRPACLWIALAGLIAAGAIFLKSPTSLG